MEIKTLSPTASNLSDTERSENVRGAAWMTASMFGYVVNDAFIKRAAEDMPLFQAVFLPSRPICSQKTNPPTIGTKAATPQIRGLREDTK